MNAVTTEIVTNDKQQKVAIARIGNQQHTLILDNHEEHLAGMMKLLFHRTDYHKGMCIRVHDEAVEVNIINFQPGEWIDESIDSILLALISTVEHWMPFKDVFIDRDFKGGVVSLVFKHSGYVTTVNTIVSYIQTLTGCRLNLPPVFIAAQAQQGSIELPTQCIGYVDHVDLTDISSSFIANFNYGEFTHHVGLASRDYGSVNVERIPNTSLWMVIESLIKKVGVLK
jgi:hypothetical protein